MLKNSNDVLFLCTGGTIDKDYPRLTRGYSFEFGDPAVKRILADIMTGFNYEVVTPF